MTSIGQNISKARKAAGLTQQELAKLTKLSRSYIGDIEKDRYNPSVNTLHLIAKALCIPVQNLLPLKTWFVVNEDSPSYGESPPLTPKESKLIEEYRKSSDNVRKSIDALLQL